MPITDPKEAGKGEAKPYRVPETPSGETLSENDYLVVRASTWYVNKKDGWFSDNQISGSVKIAMGGEEYSLPLGLFRLKGGTKTAPLFRQPLLPQRVFQGSGVNIEVKLKSIKADNFLGGLLRSAATTGLGIAKGLVQTATLAGPSAVLTGAGKEVLESVQKALDEGGENRESFFDEVSGLRAGLDASQIARAGTFVLFHRGTELDDDLIKIEESGGFSQPHFDNAPLEDGCWVLLHLSASSVYDDVRPTDQEAKQLFRDIKLLVKRVEDGLVTKEAAAAALAVNGQGSTHGDRGFALQSLINKDGVLTSADATRRAGEIGTWIRAAREAIKAKEPLKYFESVIRKVTEAGGVDRRLPEIAKEALKQAVESISAIPGRRVPQHLAVRAAALLGRDP